MTVQEWIDTLKGLPPDAEVEVFADYGDLMVYPISAHVFYRPADPDAEPFEDAEDEEFAKASGIPYKRVVMLM